MTEVKVLSDSLSFEPWLREHGVQEFPRSPTTFPRRDKLLRFIASAEGICTAEEVKALVARRDDADPASIHNSGSVYLTYACPQAAKTTLWIAAAQRPGR